jgi:hypothetical protein
LVLAICVAYLITLQVVLLEVSVAEDQLERLLRVLEEQHWGHRVLERPLAVQLEGLPLVARPVVVMQELVVMERRRYCRLACVYQTRKWIVMTYVVFLNITSCLW